MGRRSAHRLNPHDTREVVQRAVESLQALFGKRIHPASELEAVYSHDRQSDPYARGAYTYVMVGGRGACRTLAEPLDDTLFFAGEAADVEAKRTPWQGLCKAECALHERSFERVRHTRSYECKRNAP